MSFVTFGGGGQGGGATGNARRMRAALVVEPDEACAAQIDSVLRQVGVVTRVAADAEAGWRAFAAERPDVVFTALSTPRRDASWLLRRMREDYLGALPPLYGLAEHAELTSDTRSLELDGVLLRPLAGDALRALAGEEGLSPRDGASRLRDLYDLSLLGDDLEIALAAFLERLALNFRVADCVLWGPPHEGRWPKTRRPPGRPEQQAFLLWRCDLALAAGATVIAAEAPAGDVPVLPGAPARSVLAVPLDAPGARAMGALCLVDDGARRFGEEDRDVLVMVARRLARELAWRSAHDRLAEEYGRLREHAQRDPLLGLLTTSAFEEELAGELQRAADIAPLSLAVIDVAELRQINDRHGHDAGDAVLVHVGKQAEAQLRPVDRLARIGADELAFMLPGMSAREAHAQVDRLRLTIARTDVRHHGLDIPVRIRAGITQAGPGDHPEDLVSRAKLALGEAKRARSHAFTLLAGEPLPGDSVSAASELGPVLDELESEPDLLPAGATLGGMYQILHEISRGAMGVVYRAEDLGLGRPVAIKMLRADLAKDADLVARFREEAALLANLRHEHLVQVYSFGAREKDVYFVMELVEGEALSDLMQRADEAGEPLASDLVASIVSQVGGALDALHQVGAVHRDVKPANILLDRGRDRAVLVDVGVAKRRGGQGDAAGTPGFAAPESFTQGEEGPSTDVYGLAATAYMMLTNLAPFGGGDVQKVVRRQLGDRPAAPSALRPELATRVDTVLLRALAPSARERYGSAIEFAHALGHALSEPGAGPLAVGTAPPGAADAAAGMTRASELLEQGTRKLATPVAADGALAGGQSRGALFRVAYRILGNRLGSAWVRRAIEDHPGLADVLRPTVSPVGWYPTDRLVMLLRSVPAGIRDPRKVARELGRATMTSTFTRFYGSDPSSSSPDEVLGAAAAFWSEYHRWGEVRVERSAGAVRVHVSAAPEDELLPHMVEGSLERIAELAGASKAQAKQLPAAAGGEWCFEVRWSRA